MKYTENYHLPQWVKTDRIMMDDFNQMCANLEEGITEAKETADGAAAEAAKLPYVVGTYVGNGEMLGDVQEINLGFRPSFVIISGQKEVHGPNNIEHLFSIATAGTTFSSLFTITDSGFRVSASVNDYPQANQAGRVYDYIAFR